MSHLEPVSDNGVLVFEGTDQEEIKLRIDFV